MTAKKTTSSSKTTKKTVAAKAKTRAAAAPKAKAPAKAKAAAPKAKPAPAKTAKAKTTKAAAQKTAAAKAKTTTKATAAKVKAAPKKPVAAAKAAKAKAKAPAAKAKAPAKTKAKAAPEKAPAKAKAKTGQKVPAKAPAGKKSPATPKRAPKDDDKHFTAKELEEFRLVMVALAKRLTNQADELREQSLLRHDEVNHDEDGTDAFERATRLDRASAGEAQIFQINKALEAIEDGTYGLCEACGGKIERPRLEALPFVKTCIECQSKLEDGGRGRRSTDLWD